MRRWYTISTILSTAINTIQIAPLSLTTDPFHLMRSTMFATDGTALCEMLSKVSTSWSPTLLQLLVATSKPRLLLQSLCLSMHTTQPSPRRIVFSWRTQSSRLHSSWVRMDTLFFPARSLALGTTRPRSHTFAPSGPCCETTGRIVSLFEHGKQKFSVVAWILRRRSERWHRLANLGIVEPYLCFL